MTLPLPGTVLHAAGGHTRTVLRSYQHEQRGLVVCVRRSEEPDRVAEMGLIGWSQMAAGCRVIPPETRADVALATDPGRSW